MQTFIVTATIALTSTVVAADQATYDQYIDRNYQFTFCVGFGDVLEDDYLDEMVDVVGEDTAIEVMDVRKAAISGSINLIWEVGDDSSMNKIWKKRYYNNATNRTGQFDGWSHATSTYKVVGIEATVTSFFEQCKK